MAQRTWFITGVNSGFGRHLSEQLLERGDRVAGTIRKDGSVDDLKSRYGDQFWTAHLDVTDVPATRAVVGQAFPGGSMYHATKWGIEGFAEAVGKEVAPFGIGVTIVEPGGARTGFRYGSAQVGPRLAAYDGTPAAAIRAVLEDGTAVPPGDPAKMAAAIIASAGTEPAPSRIALGSDAYGIIRQALTDRLAVIQPQRDTAAATDFPPGQ